MPRISVLSLHINSIILLLGLGGCFGLLSRSAIAGDHFLTIGGGYAPAHSQLSLEKNVLFVQQVFRAWEVPTADQDILFGCGDAPNRDVQINQMAEIPRVNLLLSQISNRDESMDYGYRHHAIPHVAAAATRQALNGWIDGVGQRLGEGDRLFIYFTGHGGSGNPARNTTMMLWGDDALPVRDFTRMLDRLSPKVQVVLVMVQCHSGGFADVIFNDAQSASAASALSPANRCGFFATVPERSAAGCTSDISDEDYHEYSTYFWAALYGKTRTGASVASADYNGDGRVSLAEAHAYVQLHSDTIDVPVSTSATFLRAFSKSKGDDLLTPDSTFDQIEAAANASQKAVLDGLSEQLGLWGRERTKMARVQSDKLERDRQSANQQSDRANGESKSLRGGIRAAVLERWPELSNPWNPRAADVLKADGAQIVRLIENHPSYARWRQTIERSDSFSDRAMTLERKWAKCQRFLRAVDDVALAANLPKVGSEEIQERYAHLCALEDGFVGKPYEMAK